MTQPSFVNANFHSLSGQNLHDMQSSEKYKAYRKHWKEWPDQAFVGPFPLHMDLETTSACNLRCPFCASTQNERLSKGRMDFDLYAKIIQEGAKKGLCAIKYNYRGEPLLHPRLVEMVALAKQVGILDVYFNTNGALLTPAIAQGLIEAGLDRISISFEGFEKDFYERQRVGAVFEKTLENIEMLRQMKKKLGRKNPLIRVQTVALPELQGKLDQYNAFWKDRVDEVAYLDFKDVQHPAKGVVSSWRCPPLWHRMCVTWDGRILPCHHDDRHELELGNARDMTIEEAWKHPRLTEWRRQHIEGQAHCISACDGCVLRDSEIKKTLSI